MAHSKLARQILDKTPQEVKNKVGAWAERTISDRRKNWFIGRLNIGEKYQLLNQLCPECNNHMFIQGTGIHWCSNPYCKHAEVDLTRGFAPQFKSGKLKIIATVKLLAL